MSERLLFRRLEIVGPSRSYEVDFGPGVNIIAGPVMTGKSSVLKLLDYCMGARHKPEFPEIKKCSFVCVELVAGGETLTVRRSLRSDTASIELFEGTLAEVAAGTVKARLVAARQHPELPSLSSELMNRIGWSDVKVKTAPTQDASDSSTFSLRDLVPFLYVDQTRVSDDRNAFFERDPFKKIKWKAGVDLMYGLHDASATTLAAALAAAQAEEQALRRHLAAAQRFLDDSSVPLADVLRAQLAVLAGERNELLERQGRLRVSSDVELGESLVLVRTRDSRRGELREKRAQLSEINRNLSQLGRLRVQYERERAQLEFLGESERLIGVLPVLSCPVCAQGVEYREGADCYLCSRPLPQKEKEVTVERRLKATRRRIGDVEEYMSHLAETRDALVAQIQRDESDISEMTASLARVEQTSVLPSARALAEVGALLGDVERRQSLAADHLNLRERAEGVGSNLLSVQERVRRLQAQVQEASRERRNPEEVAGRLGEILREVLREVRFPYLSGVGIEASSMHPLVRGAPYRELSSKGAVSLVVTAWHLATLRYALERPVMFPMLLMLDSPLNHVGRDSADPDFADQKIVEAFYALLGALHQSDRDRFQIIMVDNHPPASAKGLIVAEFVGKGREGRSGLISDE